MEGNVVESYFEASFVRGHLTFVVVLGNFPNGFLTVRKNKKKKRSHSVIALSSVWQVTVVAAIRGS